MENQTRISHVPDLQYVVPIAFSGFFYMGLTETECVTIERNGTILERFKLPHNVSTSPGLTECVTDGIRAYCVLNNRAIAIDSDSITELLPN